MDEKVNVNGSGISLGHPIGATGVMRLTTLINEITRRNCRYVWKLYVAARSGNLHDCGKKIV